MSSTSDDSREQGIEFGPLAEDLENEEYPLSQEELLDRYGDREIVLVDGSATLSEILDPENEREYEDEESVRSAVFSMVGDDAIGRDDYSDRGGNDAGVDPSEDVESV